MSEKEPPKAAFGPLRRSAHGRTEWEEAIERKDQAETRLSFLAWKLKEAGIPLTKDTKILELGSGNSIYVNYLREQGLDAVGIDDHPRGEVGPHIYTGRIEALPFPDNSFDVLTSHNVFDSGVYNQYQDEMLTEMVRVLKPGGVYVVNERQTDMEKLSKGSLTLISPEADLVFFGLYQKK